MFQTFIPTYVPDFSDHHLQGFKPGKQTNTPGEWWQNWNSGNVFEKNIGVAIMKIFRAFFPQFETWHDSHHGRTVMLSFIFRFIFTLVHISCFCCSCSISFNCCPYGFPKWSIWDSERWHLNDRKSVFVPPGLFLLLLSYLPWIHMAARK